MNKIIFFFVAIIIMIISSCDNTLVVNADSKDIPIVYGIINASDTAQYIKVERVFQAGDITAFEAAMSIDSLYYKDVDVTLVNETKDISVSLEKVNGNLEGYPRESGIFLQDPNYLYKVKTNELNLDADDIVRLNIDRNDDSETITSSVVVIDLPELLSPFTFSGQASSLNFSSVSKTMIQRAESDHGVTMDVTFFIHIKEVDHSGSGSTSIKTLEWNVLSGYTKLDYKLDGAKFYTFIASQLEENIDITRTILSIDLHMIIGGQEVNDLLKLGQANTFSITSSEAIPDYSNLSEGYGIFGSVRDSVYAGFNISQQSLDTLRLSEVTAKYNFN